MDDDTELWIAAAATAAAITWVGTRSRERAARRAAGRPDWRKTLQAIRAGLARSWREAPIYQFIKAVRDAFFRKR
jgi:hypothetical protein